LVGEIRRKNEGVIDFSWILFYYLM
jgi:hypothetical protein